MHSTKMQNLFVGRTIVPYNKNLKRGIEVQQRGVEKLSIYLSMGDEGESKLFKNAKDGKTVGKEIDIYRDTPIRLLGYANEVGESFRALVPVRVVHASYVIASGYVLADTGDKVSKLKKVLPLTEPNYKKKIAYVAMDTLIWQSLASVIIPGFTINRICALSLHLLKKFTHLPPVTRKWTTTAIGLGCIPFIVKPIDNLVDLIMDASFRKWMELEKKGPSH